MNKKEIDQCSDIDKLEHEKMYVYRDCVDINDCSLCFHANDNDKCDLQLLTSRIGELFYQ